MEPNTEWSVIRQTQSLVAGGEQKSPGGVVPCSPQQRQPRYLHTVRLIAHGHRLAAHVAYAAGLWRLGDGREALRGLRSHIL